MCVLQCVAVCCSVLQCRGGGCVVCVCVAVCCSVLQRRCCCRIHCVEMCCCRIFCIGIWREKLTRGSAEEEEDNVLLQDTLCRKMCVV